MGEFSNMVCGVWLTHVASRHTFTLSHPTVEAAHAPGDTNGPEVLYAFYNVQTYGDAPVAELCAVAALTFYHPRSAPPVDEQILADAFDLSPAECRIAHLLAEGLTQKEIAARVGVQHDTVRKQLQSVFQKTATRRQPDLLRLLLNLPVHRTQQTHRTHAG